MIQCSSLSKYFDGVPVLSDVTLTVESGSIYGLTGSNGAGKSTLMRIISGIYQQDGGTVTLGGEPVWENAACKEKVIFAADDPYFLPQATLEGMAHFYGRFYPQFDRGLYEMLCGVFSLDAKKRIHTFSKGMQRQAGFLLGLAAQPRWLLLDECFDGLDPVKRQAVRKILSDAAAGRGMSVIISSHNLRELDEICDTVGVLHQGRLLCSCELDSLKGEVVKLQAVFRKTVTKEELQAALDLLHIEQKGRFFTMVAKGSDEALYAALAPFEPMAVERFPLTLEEIFLYQMEVEGYDANVIFS